jgi:hypothetical protein
MHVGAIAETINSVGVVYRSRIKVDAFDTLRSFADNMENLYQSMQAFRFKALKRKYLKRLVKYK